MATSDKSQAKVLDLAAERNAAQERRSARSRKAAETRRRNKLTEQRPYLLESSIIRADMERHNVAALAEIEAVEADMLSIETRANNDIAAIRERADAEIAARKIRCADLQSILDMTNRALGRDENRQADNSTVALALADARRSACETGLS
ncbi:MAG TPA: hypothetical protein VFT69_16940 [Pseudolabrys sp.]|nr:hypothetical protein [Pseudolabrys sp.]